MPNKKIKLNIVFICALIIGCFFINFNAVKALGFINYNSLEISSDEYTTLQNLGFTTNEIYYMDEATFNANKDLDATLMSQTTKYFKRVENAFGISYDTEVTEEEFNNPTNNLILGMQSTYYYTVVTTITAVNTYYRYKISVTWSNMPSVTKYDIIGIGYQDSLTIKNSVVYFSYYYTEPSGSTYTEAFYYARQVTGVGSSTTFDFPDDVIGFGVTMYYDVVKDDNNTITYLSMCGDYAHAISNSVTGSLAANHTISYGGIGLNSSNINLFSAIPCTYENKNVNW